MHRIAPHRALEQATRRRVYEAICQEPGARVATLARRLGLAHASARHHVRMLQALGLVELAGAGQPGCFPRLPHLGSQAHRAALACRSPSARRVLAALPPGAAVPWGALVARLALPKSTASEALARLAVAGVVRKERAGGRLWVVLAVPPSGPLPSPASPTPTSPGLQGGGAGLIEARPGSPIER